VSVTCFTSECLVKHVECNAFKLLYLRACINVSAFYYIYVCPNTTACVHMRTGIPFLWLPNQILHLSLCSASSLSLSLCRCVCVCGVCVRVLITDGAVIIKALLRDSLSLSLSHTHTHTHTQTHTHTHTNTRVCVWCLCTCVCVCVCQCVCVCVCV